MTDPEPTTCSRCGAPLPAGETRPLCSACLLSGALNPPPDATVPLEAADLPPPPEPRMFPCAFGPYLLHGLLGQGGMGTVYDAEELATSRRVALKRLGQRFDSPEMRHRFLREGRLAAGVSHPNSLYVFGSEEIEGAPVITMEVAAGGTLQDRLDERGPLTVPEAVDAILDVLDGLEAAHRAGVLHRDLKPSNCFVAPDGSVKIGDFGLSVSTVAREDTFVTAGGVILGTPAFAPPEQLRGDVLDIRADLYSVGATLFTLLTGRAPFTGDNAVQVVARVLNDRPSPLSAYREDLPSGLEPVVARCLAKNPDDRPADIGALRNALLRYSSREPEPATMKARVLPGWIDYLLAFLVPYLVLMLSVGAVEFHVQPLIDRTLASARYYLAFLGIGILFFTVLEGFWGAGPGKRIRGLRVVRPDGRRPGPVRALARILVQVLAIEGVRIPFLLLTISVSSLAQWTGKDTAIYILATNACAWIPVLLQLGARRENGFCAAWDRVSGTRVVVVPRGRIRAPGPSTVAETDPSSNAGRIGPYRVDREVVPGEWIAGTDPVLRRPVWLLRRRGTGPTAARREVARATRCRWLQAVESSGVTWDAYEAVPGGPFTELVADGSGLPWVRLRDWLDDLAEEIWAAARDDTLPTHLGLDRVWITASGRALLLEAAWPVPGGSSEPIPVRDPAGQQQFLSAVARCVDPAGLPLHARPVLRNLAAGRFEKLSFVAGTLRGLVGKPAEVTRGIRVGAIAMLPVYLWVLLMVGSLEDNPWTASPASLARGVALLVLGVLALVQLIEIPFGTTAAHSIYRLAVVDERGDRVSRARLLARWAVVWLPLVLPVATLLRWAPGGSAAQVAVLVSWLGAAAWILRDPHRGLHDRLTHTRVVRE